MRSVSLIAAADHDRPAAPDRDHVQIAGQCRRSAVIPVARAQPKAEHHRPAEGVRKAVPVLDRQHNIVLLIRRNLLRYQVKLPEIPLAFLQLDNDNIRIRRRAQIFQPAPEPAARRNRREVRSVSVRVPAGHDCIRLLRLQCAVDLRPCVFASVEKPIRGRSCLDRLIPDGKNPACSVLSAEHRGRIVDSRVDENDHAALPCKSERCALNLCNSADNKGIRVERRAGRPRPLHESV